MRWCKKVGCSESAVASCAFNYDTRQVWITALISDPHPACFDLCGRHAQRFVAPLGWELHDLRPEATELEADAELSEADPEAELADDQAHLPQEQDAPREPEPAWEPEPAVSRALF